MLITKKDVLWSYAATFLKIAASALLLPFILKILPSETVGVWSVFMTLTAFTTLLDFGFGPSFSRNITYIFSGVKSLKTNGFEIVDVQNSEVDYSLLKGTINAMRWFYFQNGYCFISVACNSRHIFMIHSLLGNYTGDDQEVYIAWVILFIVRTHITYILLYYDSLLMGYGLSKKVKADYNSWPDNISGFSINSNFTRLWACGNCNSTGRFSNYNTLVFI